MSTVDATIREQKNWSKYQLAIFDTFKQTPDNIMVNAVAGSGKTTVIVELSNRVPLGASVVFCAFGKDIVTALQDKVGAETTCKTINALGHGALTGWAKENNKRIKLDDYKYRSLVTQATELEVVENKLSLVQELNKLVSFCQSTLADTDDESLSVVCDQYGIELELDEAHPEAWHYDVVRFVLSEGERIAREDGIISFNDQLWLPTKWNLPLQRYDVVFVDEVQDLSRAKLEIVLKLKRRGGRIVGVGDPNQSIMGFAGADPRAWGEIVERTNATVLPLSVCYRCPKAVIEVAQQTVAHIEHHEDAEEGVFTTISGEKFYSQVGPNDLVLCRYTAPLIRACIELIKLRKPARVKGRDIAKQLLTMAREALKGGYDWSQFDDGLREYVRKETTKLTRLRNSDQRVHALNDRADGLLACYEAFDSATFAEFSDSVNDLFSDSKSLIELSTIHKAKGLEADHVYTLSPDHLGKEQKLSWQTEQENNLKYVNDTRAKKSLTYVK